MGQMLDRKWEFPVQQTSLDKHTNRTGVQRGRMAKLTGVDGSQSGGLRLFHGFKLVKDAMDATGTSQGRYTGTSPFKRLTSITTIHAFLPISLQANSASGHGWVIQASGLIDGVAAYQVFVLFHNGSGWLYHIVFSTTTSGEITTGQAQKLEVATSGRLAYVFNTQSNGSLLLYGTDSAGVLVLSQFGGRDVLGSVNEIIGPGATPHFEFRSASGSSTLGTDPTDRYLRPGNSDVSRISLLGTSIDDREGATAGAAAGDDAIVNAHGTFGSIDSSTDCFYWTSARRHPQDVGATNFANRVPLKLPIGNYSFAYRFYDAVSGRFSALSKVVTIAENDFAGYPQYALVEILYDSAKYTHVYIYRSINTAQFGNSLVNGVLLQEAYLTLADYTSTNTGTGHCDDAAASSNQPEGPGTPPTNFSQSGMSLVGTIVVSGGGDKQVVNAKRMTYWISLADQSLSANVIFPNAITVDAFIPAGRAAIVFDRTMIVSDVAGTGTSENVTGVGEIRWSSLTERSLESFPPDNRYIPSTGTDPPIRFFSMSDRVLGSGYNRNYLIFTAPGHLAVREVHKGWGITGRRAGCVVGNEVHLVSPSGILAFSPDGGVDQIESLNYLIQREWRSQRATLQAAFDAELKCVFFLRPPSGAVTDFGGMACLWLTTSMVTELTHTNFVAACQGIEPNVGGVERAFFITSGGKIHKVDVERSRTYSGATRTSMLDVQGHVNVKLHATTPAISYNGGTTETTFTIASDYTLVGGTSTGSIVGSVVTFVSGAQRGNSYLVTACNAGARTITLLTGTTLAGSLAAGDKLVISPIVFEAVAWAAGMVDEMDQPSYLNELFRVRYSDYIGAHFIDVTGREVSDAYFEADNTHNFNAKWAGVVYRGNETAAFVENVVADPSGAEWISVRDGTSKWGAYVPAHGALLFPGVRIYAGDLDFTLVGITLQGTIEETEREEGV